MFSLIADNLDAVTAKKKPKIVHAARTSSGSTHFERLVLLLV